MVLSLWFGHFCFKILCLVEVTCNIILLSGIAINYFVTIFLGVCESTGKKFSWCQCERQKLANSSSCGSRQQSYQMCWYVQNRTFWNYCNVKNWSLISLNFLSSRLFRPLLALKTGISATHCISCMLRVKNNELQYKHNNSVPKLAYLDYKTVKKFRETNINFINCLT